MDELTPNNFIAKIKAMDVRERGKIPLKKLLDIICQVPDDADVTTTTTQIDELRGAIRHINEMATKNKTEIDSLKI